MVECPGKPTILFYGHYDVQAARPARRVEVAALRAGDPRQRHFRARRLRRQGQVYIQIKAVEGLLKSTGKLPVNVKFLLEGEEETGGEHIEEYVKTRPPRLKADAAVVCDTEMFAPEFPTICVGLRGLVYYELLVEGANHDLHSGVYGGAAPNPMQAIAEIICALKDRNGHILIPGFYDRVVPPSPKEREAWRGCRSTKRSTRKSKWARASWWASPSSALRACVGAAHGGSARHPRRVHRRRRQDRDSGPRGGQDQHAPGGRSLVRSLSSNQGRGEGRVPQGVTAELKVLSAARPR